MKMADILRSVADSLDQAEGGESEHPENVGMSADDFQHEVHGGAESGDQEAEVSPVMIPPLQQNIEILKKLSGIQ